MNVPQRSPRADTEDDHVLPFQVDALDVRGRVVRLGPALNEVLAHHDYPAPVARLVAEATTIAVLLGSSLKQVGRFIFQSQTDGPVDMLIVDISAPERVRAYARFDAARVAQAVAKNEASSGALLGNGHLAMTIEAGTEATRYQGIVALAGEGLEAAAHRYFAQSEQIPSKLRLAVGEEVQTGGRAPKLRAGGLLVQFLPPEAARAARADLDPGDAPAGTQRHAVAEDDAWVEAQALVATVEDHELLDPSLSSERLLYRLFNQPGVRVFASQPVTGQCTCSRERVEKLLNAFSPEDRTGMVENGKVIVKCEFCGRAYEFEPGEVGVASS